MHRSLDDTKTLLAVARHGQNHSTTDRELFQQRGRHVRGRRRHSVRDVRRTVQQTLRAAFIFVLPAWFLLWQSEAILLAMELDGRVSADNGRYRRLS